MNTWGILLLAWGAFLAGWLGRSCFTCRNCGLYINLSRKLIVGILKRDPGLLQLTPQEFARGLGVSLDEIRLESSPIFKEKGERYE